MENTEKKYIMQQTQHGGVTVFYLDNLPQQGIITTNIREKAKVFSKEEVEISIKTGYLSPNLGWKKVLI